MVEIGGGVAFPVVFFDGESESDIGNVFVYPSLDFKRFQSILSRKIGISPHQFSVYLSSPEARRRIPITGKVNFGAISREKGCFFVVVLKRSRRERRRKNNHQDFQDVTKKNPPENVMILRRDMGFSHGQSSPGFLSPFSDRVGYEKRVINLQLERERYLVNMGLSGLGLGAIEPGAADEDEGVKSGVAAVCEDCVRAKESGTEAGFHWCVYDAVTFGFRSPAGPIARPFKASTEFGSLGYSEI